MPAPSSAQRAGLRRATAVMAMALTSTGLVLAPTGAAFADHRPNHTREQTCAAAGGTLSANGTSNPRCTVVTATPGAPVPDGEPTREVGEPVPTGEPVITTTGAAGEPVVTVTQGETFTRTETEVVAAVPDVHVERTPADSAVVTTEAPGAPVVETQTRVVGSCVQNPGKGDRDNAC